MGKGKFSEKYRLMYPDSALGKGQFGTVYLAETLGNNPKEVAVKVIDRRRFSSESIVHMRNEAKNMEALSTASKSHPHIVQFYDYFEEKDYIYLVMELLAGGELYEDVVSRVYTESHARYMIYVLLKSVQYMHAHNIVHRDLKPENLLLSNASTDEAIIKIADFGLSIKLKNSKALISGDAGTPTYKAPEIIANQKYGKEVDVWSIGVITFVLLSRSFPFFHPNRYICEQLVSLGKFRFAEKIWTQITPVAKDFIRRLLVVDPKARFTVDQALQHPWFRLKESALSRKLTFSAAAAFYCATMRWKKRVKAKSETNERASKSSSSDEEQEDNNNPILFSLPLYGKGSSLLYHALQEESKTYFTTVYNAIDIQNNEEVLIKVHNTKHFPQRLLQLLNNEINILTTIKTASSSSSPSLPSSVTKLHAVYREGDFCYVVEEKIYGRELLDRLSDTIGYNELEAKRLIIGLFQAISRMHELNIVHKNIKLENLLLSSDAVDANLKLTNYQLAEQLSFIELTSNDIKKANDVLSVGMILHLLLVGKNPHIPEEVEGEEYNNEIILKDEDGWDQISIEGKDLVKNLLHPNPLHRPSIDQALTHPWFTAIFTPPPPPPPLTPSSKIIEILLESDEESDHDDETDDGFMFDVPSDYEGNSSNNLPRYPPPPVPLQLVTNSDDGVMEDSNNNTLQDTMRNLRLLNARRKFQGAIHSLIFINRVKRCMQMTKEEMKTKETNIP
eukprot:CAMPEP_0173147512 /NCGR_PEP_ID=MMETSP1105-20130129/9178_1 /TAXON_ID=2985 /ORGANISM="Ochromonas sp., Strain BG-1" /LENGTH=731 /DNA_ID=CAMNT_0014062009 /DNA_START=102 /DNA_END=2297 /DNA_ORIENTATION=+